MWWLLLAGWIVSVRRLCSPTSKEEKEMLENSPDQQESSPEQQENSPSLQENKKDKTWRDWPIIEQFIQLKRKIAFTELSWLWRVLFAIILLVSMVCVLHFEIKRAADFAGIFFLYLATLMLALQPERTSGESDESLAPKQKRHIRIALGFVVFGTAMQLSSFNLSGKETNDEIETRLDRLESQLNPSEQKNVVQADALAKAKSERQPVKEVTEGIRVNQRQTAKEVSRSVPSKQGEKLQQEVQK